jgi:uncharacterized protein (DUF433 family)
MFERAHGVRPAMRGTRLEVGRMVTVVRDNDGSERQAADYLEVDLELIQEAMRYYRAHRAQIDAWIAEDEEYAERAYADWERAHGHKFR